AKIRVETRLLHRPPRANTCLPLRRMPSSMLLHGYLWWVYIGGVVVERQREHERCPLAKLALCPQLATVPFHNVPGNSQPESGALVAVLSMIGTLVKLVEDPCHVLCWDALARIRDPYFHPVTRIVALQRR